MFLFINQVLSFKEIYLIFMILFAVAGHENLTTLLSLKAEFRTGNIIRKVFGVILLAKAVKLFTFISLGL